MNHEEALEVKDLVKPCNDVLEELGWKWEPRIGDKVCRGGMILFYAKLIRAIHGKRAGRFISDAGTEYEWPVDFVTPIPPWEKIEEILEEMGYVFQEPIRRCYGSEGYKCHCVIEKSSKRLGWGWGKTRGEAVRQSVIALGKKLK